MNRTQTFITASVLSLSLLIGSFAEAAVTTFNSRPNWEAVAGASQSMDFATTDSGDPISTPDGVVAFESLTLKGVTFLNVVSYYNDFIFTEPGAVVRINLPANTKAFGMDITPVLNSPGNYTIVLSTGEVFNPLAGDFPGQDDFFGVTSATPIEWLEISLDSSYLGIEKFSFVAANPVTQVGIDIVPFLSPNYIIPSLNLPIPVAILSTATFNAASVNASTVRFGVNGTEAASVKTIMQDVNRDGRKDMVLFFYTKQTGITKTTTQGKLTGQTNTGASISGTDSIKALAK